MRIGYETSDTVCALATPYGTSALAIVRVSGEKAFEIVGKLINKPLPKQRGGRHFYRRVGLALNFSPDGDLPKEFAEGFGPNAHPEARFVDAVLICFESPASFTGEDVIEITLPGNMLIVESLLEGLKALGARTAEPGEFSFRAYLNGKMDLSQAEAVNDTIRAGSEEVLRLALNQLGGELSMRVREWLSALNKLLAHIEVVHDYPGGVADASVEEEEARGGFESEAEFVTASLVPIVGELESAIDFYNRYSRLREGLKVVILGAPNVGKSTLFNRLLGFERAIVTEVPGTTRDYLEESVNVGGVRVCLVDTAGLREADNLVEMIGVERARKLISEADAVIVMEEVAHFYPESVEPLPRVAELIGRLKDEGRHFSLVINKVDEILGADKDKITSQAEKAGATPICAVTGEGLGAVREFLRGLAEVEDTGTRFLLTDRQKRLTESALDSLTRANDAVQDGTPLDVVSIDLYDAQRALSAILSLESHDMVLDEIFKNFCVGK